MVWAAGVQAADFLKDIGGLETNRLNQLVVRPTLQTTRDDDIFSLRRLRRLPPDRAAKATCAAPRASGTSAGIASVWRRSNRRLAGEPLQAYRYRDFGSLVSLGEFSTVGNLMGGLIGGKPA